MLSIEEKSQDKDTDKREEKVREEYLLLGTIL